MEKRKYKREHEGILGLKGLSKRTGKKLTRMRKRRRAIMANDKLTIIERDKRVKEVDREVKAAIDKFNKQYDMKVKK